MDTIWQFMMRHWLSITLIIIGIIACFYVIKNLKKYKKNVAE